MSLAPKYLKNLLGYFSEALRDNSHLSVMFVLLHN